MARPLNKHTPTGKRYCRPRKIERILDAALKTDLIALEHQLKVTDSSDSHYLPSECLVHLMRDARRRDDQIAMSTILPFLLSRGEAILQTKIPDGNLPDAANLRDEILQSFAERFAIDDSAQDQNELDYYECRFNDAFRKFRISAMRRERTERKSFAQLPPISNDKESDSDGAEFSRVSKAFARPATQVDSAYLSELNSAIDALPTDEREAVMLCGRLGYAVESNDPTKVTAATLCGVTGKTIQNRLRRAAAKLSRFKEEG